MKIEQLAVMAATAAAGYGLKGIPGALTMGVASALRWEQKKTHRFALAFFQSGLVTLCFNSTPMEKIALILGVALIEERLPAARKVIKVAQSLFIGYSFWQGAFAEATLTALFFRSPSRKRHHHCHPDPSALSATPYSWEIVPVALSFFP